MQFHANTKVTSHSSHVVTFDPRPKPEVEDDAEAEPEDVLGQAPELSFDLLPGVPVPRTRAERPLPFILREADGIALVGEPRCECGLSRPGQPAGQDQSHLAHDVSVQQFCELDSSLPAFRPGGRPRDPCPGRSRPRRLICEVRVLVGRPEASSLVQRLGTVVACHDGEVQLRDISALRLLSEGAEDSARHAEPAMGR